MLDPIALSSPSPSFSLVSTTRVPNVQPTASSPDYRLAIVGEAPGEREETHGVPFIGPSGDLLTSLLSSAGVQRAACFIGNVCQFRPPGNEIMAFGFGHEKVISGWEILRDELTSFRPHCILALGNTPLHFLTDRVGVTSWRGSILSSPYGKVVPAIHPAAVLRDYKLWPLLRFDIQRARQEAQSADLVLPKRTLELYLSANEICNRLDNWPAGRLLSFDIEGGLDAFPCCSVADDAHRGFIIAWSRHSDAEQGRIGVALSRLLYRSDVPKVLQNSLYDRFVLAYGYNMLIRNVREDTMVKQWEIYPELPKGLGTIASIWTREPYYKFEGKRGNKGEVLDTQAAQETYWKYCIKDSCVTLESSNAMTGALSPESNVHYRLNMDLLSPLLYMELRGIRYDKLVAEAELSKVRTALDACRDRINTHAGRDLTGKKGSLSPQRLKECLYREKGYPEQKSGRGPDAKVSTDVEALLNLQKKFTNDAFLSDILLHRKLEGLAETLEVTTDHDGRVRCGYNLVGTETGRLTCYTSPTGSGANLQTITKKLRKLYVADPDYWMFQCDLSGADGWTVAAHCLRHGDPTMWDDYRAGLKPAKIIALMYATGKSVPSDREELREACKKVDQDGWLYFSSKQTQHGSNYGMQEKTMSVNIMKLSYKFTGKAVYVDPQTCAALQRLYLTRYPGIYQWHNWAKRQVESGANLRSSSGHTRIFFGRRKSWDARRRCMDADHETWKEFLADEPQENTTYATNLALHKLWHDKENRRPVDDVPLRLKKGFDSLYIQPLHQVHDALIGQFPKDRTEWAVAKIRSYFANVLRIADTEVTIPFEGAYGPSWGNLGHNCENGHALKKSETICAKCGCGPTGGGDI